METILMRRWLTPQRTVLLGWVLYGFGILGCFMLWLFPYDVLHARLLHELTVRSGIAIVASHWSPLWLGVQWDSVRLTAADVPPLVLTEATLRLDAQTLLQGRPALKWMAIIGTAPSPHGRLAGTLTPNAWWPTLFGAARLEQNVWRFDVTELTLRPDEAARLGFPALPLQEIHGRIACVQRTCYLEELTGHGPTSRVTAQGHIVLGVPLSRSELALTVAVQPLEDNNGMIGMATVTVQGQVLHPVVTVSAHSGGERANDR